MPISTRVRVHPLAARLSSFDGTDGAVVAQGGTSATVVNRRLIGGSVGPTASFDCLGTYDGALAALDASWNWRSWIGAGLRNLPY